MHARVTRYEVKQENVDAAIHLFQQSAVTANKGELGFKQSLLLVDRETGKAISLTLWESDADMNASMATHQQRVGQGGNQDYMREPPRTETYEVSVNERP